MAIFFLIKSGVISIISFCVRVITDVDTTRNYLQTQMASHAQDTATSLGSYTPMGTANGSSFPAISAPDSATY